MKSVSIKFTSQKTTKSLLDKLQYLDFNDVYYSCKKFKSYYNVIVHFKGKDEDPFLNCLSRVLSQFIICTFENSIIKSLIKSEYFYFDKKEQNTIFNIVALDLYNSEEAIVPPNQREDIIYNKVYNYLFFNHSLILKGFISFRIKEYFNCILEQIDKSVNKYIVEKEYFEFVSILKLYVKSEKSNCNEVHLIYKDLKPILLDENKKEINIKENLFNQKYLSDISFSNNDYTLSTLLNLVPQKIYIHLIAEGNDEFINTIKLIFENRVYFCKDCSLCNLYKKSHSIIK